MGADFATSDEASERRLSEYPDWGYLLNEYLMAYRHGPAGGSKKIRSHMRLVRERLSKCLASDPPIDLPVPVTKPVCAHLGRALDNGERDRMGSFVRAVEKVRDQLHWEYGYQSMPKGLERKYAYTDLLGPKAPVRCEGVTLGLVLFAPKTTYPAHSHKGITESYICLSGATSENDAGVYVPGAMILNGPGFEHSITTSDREPALLAYAWIGETDDLAEQQMVFSRKPRT